MIVSLAIQNGLKNMVANDSKRKTNHHNVKFLSGYGISIKQKDNQIITK